MVFLSPASDYTFFLSPYAATLRNFIIKFLMFFIFQSVPVSDLELDTKPQNKQEEEQSRGKSKVTVTTVSA